MLHRTMHCMLMMQSIRLAKCGSVKSQSMYPSFDNASMNKNRPHKSMLPTDAISFLIVTRLIRALLLLSLTPWFVSVRSFEINHFIAKHSDIAFPLKVENSNKYAMKASTMTDCLATTETARKTLTNDEILNAASKTTQLLLQRPPSQNYRQNDFDGTNETSAPKKVKTLYDILGTTPTATKEELKRQYIAMARLTHPDALISQPKNEACSKMFPDFSEVADAYQILSNPVERKKYDRTLHSTQVIQILVLLGDICIGTTLTVAEITSAIVWVTLMVILQPIAMQVSTELFYLSIDDNGSLSN